MTGTRQNQHPDTGRPSSFLTLLEARAYASDTPETKVSSFTTRNVPVRDQFDLWNSTAAASLGTVEREGASTMPFHASVDNYLTSRFGYVRHSVDHPACIVRDRKAIARGDFDGIALQLRLKGDELANNFQDGGLFSSGQIRVHDVKQPFFSRNNGYENIAIVARRDQLADRLPTIDQLNGVTLPDGVLSLLLREHMKLSLQVLEHASRMEAEQLSKVTLEVITAALLGTQYTDILSSDSVPRALIQAIHLCIERNLHRPDLGPAYIARAVGVSRSKLYEACQPSGTPMELIRMRRLARAREIIESRPHVPITEVASMVGYDNLETFSRHFRREFGYSARDFRKGSLS